MIINETNLKELIHRETLVSLDNKQTNSKKSFSSIIKSLTFSIFRILLCAKNEPSLHSNSTPNIALIRNDAIGDYVVSTGAIRLIKHYYPDCKIDVYASSKNISLISNDPNINQAILCDYKSIFSINFRKLRAIGKEKKYDYVICLNNSKTTLNAVICSLIGKSAERVIALFPKRKNIYGKVFTKQIDIDFPDLTWADRMTKLVAVTFGISENFEQFNPYIFIDKSAYWKISDYNTVNQLSYIINTANILIDDAIEIKPIEGRKYTIINISAGKATNRWSSEKCIEFLNKFYNIYPNINSNNIVYISSSPDEYNRAEEIVKTVNHENCRMYKSGLTDFIAFLCGAELLISPDTGTAHIAASAGIRSIILYPAEFHLVYWRVHSDKRVMLLSPDNESVNSIDTDEIINAINIIHNKPII